MASGRSNKIVGQTGEYLVAAELGRRGLIATTFTGNVPHYDIIASDEKGKHVSVQVKAGRGTSWQLNISHYCEITFQENKQIVGRATECPVQDLVVVFVRIAQDGNDKFYILRWPILRDILKRNHKKYLARHNGTRPKSWKSVHTAIYEKHLAPFQNKWETIEEILR